MQDATAESIKSLEGFRIAWVEEAQTLSQRSLSLLRPTIRLTADQQKTAWNDLSGQAKKQTAVITR
jgi:phage terminase large subunit